MKNHSQEQHAKQQEKQHVEWNEEQRGRQDERQQEKQREEENLPKKGDLVTVSITDMGVDGEGIGKENGLTYFIKDAVIGDIVQAFVMKQKKNCVYARLLQVITPSPWRVAPPCRVYRPCGGCQLQALSYEQQLIFKENKVRNNLIRIGGWSREETEEWMEPILGSDQPFHYRNKAQFPVGRDKNGHIVAGFYANRSHTIVPNLRCGILHPVCEEILSCVISHMEEYQIAPYEESTGKGLMRHVFIRRGDATGEIMVCLVLTKDRLPYAEGLTERLHAIEGMTSVCLNVNRKNTNVILGERIIPLWGKPYITDRIGEITYRISPHSFFQVNPRMTKHLYETALEFAALTGKETVWDLYCGIGSISLFLAKQARMVYGIEIIPQAVENARENAAENRITNAKFYTGRVEEVLPVFYRDHQNTEESENQGDSGKSQMLHPDVMVVDPPRKGCDRACLETMTEMRPDRIVYVSCDSATLARDLRILCDQGYQIRRVRPVDMFPQTVGVETCALLVKTSDSEV